MIIYDSYLSTYTKQWGDKSCGFPGQVLESSKLAKKQTMFYSCWGISIYFGESWNIWNDRSIPLEISTTYYDDYQFVKMGKRQSCHTGTVANGQQAIWAL